MNGPAGASETWNDKALANLMTYIVETHHAYCRQEMARLAALFRDAITKHAQEYPQLKRMEALFAAMAKDLQMHLVKEEQTLFPYIARMEEAARQNAAVSWPPFGTVGNPIRMMVLEHDQTGSELAELRRLTSDYTLPAGAAKPLADLYEGLRLFDLDMQNHIHAEDHLLFPRAIAVEERACSRRNATAP